MKQNSSQAIHSRSVEHIQLQVMQENSAVQQEACAECSPKRNHNLFNTNIASCICICSVLIIARLTVFCLTQGKNAEKVLLKY